MQDRAFSSFFLSSTSNGPPLRVGILLDRAHEHRATASIIEDIRAADFARIEIVLFEASADAARAAAPDRRFGGAFIRRLTDRRWWSGIAWLLYVRLDRLRVGLDSDPLTAVDPAKLLDGLDTIAVGPIVDGSERRLSESDAMKLRAARLDVLLQFGFEPLDEDIFEVAANGVWTLRYGDGERYRGDPPHFWEMVADEPVTGVTLERRGREPVDRQVLARAFFATDMGSLARNRVKSYFGSTHFVIQKLWEWHQSGWPYIAEPGSLTGVPDRAQAKAGQPTNREVVRWLLLRFARTLARRLVTALWRRDEIEQWQIAIRRDGPGLIAGRSTDMTGFRWIEAPKGQFYADPFVVERDGRTWLFFEDYYYAQGRGVISCAAIGPDGQVGVPEIVLASEGHLSYPFVFFDGEDAYMIPETAAEASVRLYRATDFPREWELHTELYAGAAVDSSVWKQDGRWWLFTSLREPRGGATMLWLFHSEMLTGPWTFHPMNPISADVRSARGAGALHREGTRLFRPSQDGSRAYGHSFSLNEIVTLSPTSYAERRIVTIGPDWERDLLATHTYNRSGAVEVTDGKVRRARRQVV